LTDTHVDSYSRARKLLFLLDTLPQPEDASRDLVFEVAAAQATVALWTEADSPRMGLVDATDRAAATPAHEQRVKVLRSEYQARSGELRPALVAALRVASPNMNPEPEQALRALFVATRCRLALGQLDDAVGQLSRARTIAGQVLQPWLLDELANLEGEVLFRQAALEDCRVHSERTLEECEERGDTRGQAIAAARLGMVLRELGDRRGAERRTHQARDTFAATGDLSLDTATRLALCTLLVERAEAAGARHMLDLVIRRCRTLHLDHLMPAAIRVLLQVATAVGDPNDAATAMGATSNDREMPAAIVRWWRTRGDMDQALRVIGPPRGTYGHTLFTLERARAALVGGYTGLAHTEAESARLAALKATHGELELYARLLLGVTTQADDDEWSKVYRAAQASMYAEVHLGALEMDARRKTALGQTEGAARRWRTLRARAEELGYRPAVEEAEGWLREDPG
jgi:hypothetical protein